MSDSLQSQLEAELLALQLREQQLAEAAASQSPDEEEAAESFPAAILPPSTPELATVKALWTRFANWINSEGASELLRLNPPASVRDFFTLQRSIAPEGCDPADCELPADVAAHFACHDGQAWGSVTGVIGRFYLLDAAAAFAEWRDQCDMMEMGLYTGGKYARAKKAAGSHSRIDTSEWFNRGWLPLACSGGRGLGGDLICVDLRPLRNLYRGQIIMYRPESGERFVLADSFAEWMERVVGDLEAGVYRFDAARSTYAAGVEPQAATNGSDGAAASAASSSSSSSSSAVTRGALPTAASSTIGVHGFMYSAKEGRDFFIKDRTEELVYLPENDFGLLNTEALGQEAAGEE